MDAHSEGHPPPLAGKDGALQGKARLDSLLPRRVLYVNGMHTRTARFFTAHFAVERTIESTKYIGLHILGRVRNLSTAAVPTSALYDVCFVAHSAACCEVADFECCLHIPIREIQRL